MPLPTSLIPATLGSPPKRRKRRAEKPKEETEPPCENKETAAEESPESEDIVVWADLERTHTLRQLRDMCAARDLPSSGKKSDLVKRLHAHVA